MSLDSAISAIVYDANPAAATPYPVSFLYLDPAHVHVSIMAQGAGTVTVADGAAAFSSAQPALGAGKRVRIANTVYIIAARSSDTLFNFTTRPTIAATVFHLPDDAVELNTTEYTISPDGVRTVATLPSTSKVTIYRRTPLTQPAVLPAGGPLPAATLEGMADRLTMIAQELQTGIDGIALKLPASAASFNGIAVFANTAARNAATPEFVGQTGVQLDSATLYFGTNTVQNAWTAVTAAGGVRLFESGAAMAAVTPDYVGQLAAIANTAAPAERNMLFISRGTTPGAWQPPANPQFTAYTQWERVAWRHDEPLVSGERRWVGSIPRLLEPHALFISCNTPGEGTATVKVLRPEFPNVNKSLTTDPIELTALNCGSAVITALRDAATDNITERSRIEIEIVSAGTPVSVTTVSGQTTSTPDPGSVQQVVTGAVITSPDHGDKLVVFHRGAGTAHTDVPAATTGTDTYRVTGRQFVRGIKDLALTTGDVTVPVARHHGADHQARRPRHGRYGACGHGRDLGECGRGRDHPERGAHR
ncbi:MAG TPA: hypothetical protein VG796_22430 [Verrucomicrobiales bacterium]|nr:hypothetical protein [Verrucomicrobiales bacterium]